MATCIPAELLGEIKPMIWISRIVGLCPISYQKRPQDKNQSCFVVKQSLNYTIYTWTLALIILTMSLFGLMDDFVSFFAETIRMQNLTIKYVTLVALGENVISVFVGMMVTLHNCPSFLHLLTTITTMDKILLTLSTKRPKCRKQTRHAWLLIAIGLSAVIAVFVWEFRLWCEITYRRGVLKIYLIRYGIVFFAYLLFFVHQLPYWFILRVIRRRISGVNECVENVVVRIHSMEVLQRLRRPCNYDLTNKNVVTITGMVMNKKDYERVFSDLMRVNALLHDALGDIGDLYGPTILMVIVSVILNLVVTPYFLIVDLRSDHHSKLIPLQAYWIVLHISRLVVIVESCQSCLNEVKKIYILVQNLSSSALDTKTKTMMRLFLYQLKRIKQRFSTFSLVEINRSLLTSTFASIITLIMILFQFGRVEKNQSFYSKN